MCLAAVRSIAAIVWTCEMRLQNGQLEHVVKLPSRRHVNNSLTQS